MNDEAHFSAEQPRSQAASRVPAPDGDRGWPCDHPPAPGAGSQKAVRVTTLTRRKDFIAANTARRHATPSFVLLVRDRGDADPSARLGFTVTKKIGNAVVRNRMKRRLRALARAAMLRPGADHVLIGRAGGIEADYGTMRADLAKALARVAR
jgi:ribonuclease P protein component